MQIAQSITCPDCRHSFPLDLALRDQLRGELTQEITHATELELRRIHAEEIEVLENMVADRDGVSNGLIAQLESIRQQTDSQVRAEFTSERKGLEEELARQRAALADLRRNEVELRREKLRLEEMRQELEVQNARVLDVERI